MQQDTAVSLNSSGTAALLQRFTVRRLDIFIPVSKGAHCNATWVSKSFGFRFSIRRKVSLLTYYLRLSHNFSLAESPRG